MRACAVLILACALAACQKPQPTETQGRVSIAPDDRPNFVLIVADDLGYSDLGVFGSEIATPHIDSLAQNGVVLTNFYTAPLCAPTRAELMSGTDHHRAGEGLMQVNIPDLQGYEGHLNGRVLTIAERLRDAGYGTYMAGKWHLGTSEEQTPFARGFEKTFALLEGGASHYDDQVGAVSGTVAKYSENGRPVESLPEGFYSTDHYTDKMLEYLQSREDQSEPFFAYLSYTAPHWPIQAPDDDVARQRGKYAEGYDIIRNRRFERWKTTEFATASAEPPELSQGHIDWQSLTDEERLSSARTMEIYAAMVERMDMQIGRLLEYLEATGQDDNTLIIFMSDNGPEASTTRPGFRNNVDNRFENLGRPGSFAFVGPGWAEAGSAQYYLTKSYAAEGGIRVPAIVGGGLVSTASRSEAALILGFDVAPTLLELAGIESASNMDRSDILPITGLSFAGLLQDDGQYSARGMNNPVGREHGGHAAIRMGDWKLLWVGNQGIHLGELPLQPGPHPMSGVPMSRERFDRGKPAGAPIGSGGPWKLHNIKDDPAERRDLSKEHPEIVEKLLADWDKYVGEFGVLVKSGEN